MKYGMQNIPKEINKIIYLYQKFCDAWDKKLSHSDLIIDEIGSTVKCQSSDRNERTVYGSNLIHLPSEGVCHWRIKIIAFTRTLFSACPEIGIIESRNDVQLEKYRDKGPWDDIGYQLCAGNGGLWGKDKEWSNVNVNNLEWRTVGDILEMILDLNKRTLQVILIDKDYGIVFDDIDDGSYRLAMTNWGHGDNIAEFELL